MNISFLEQLIPLPLIVTDNVNYLLPQYIGNLEKQDWNTLDKKMFKQHAREGEF